MDDGKTAPPAAKRRKKESPHVPHEIVSEILVNLPVESLMRFSCVSKAWQSTICRDASFHRAHLRRQKPCLLVSPHTLYDGHRPMDKVGLYRWEANQQCTTVPLMHDIDLTSDNLMHDFAHCDGLVLPPIRFTAYVLNPATRRTLKLPRGRGADPPRGKPLSLEMCHQVFGLRHDPRSGAYKVARSSYPSWHLFTGTRSYHSITMEVFTIGTDRHWRETVMPPPYPVLADRTATFFKGSLIWAIDERNLGKAAPGFLRFSLEDEAFGVMPPPPCYPRLEEYTQFSLSELRGELCLACEGAKINSVELWMCNSVEKPRWDRRYTIAVLMFRPPELCPIAIFDDEIVFKERVSYTRRYNLKTKAYKDRFSMENLRYHHPSTGKLAGPVLRFRDPGRNDNLRPQNMNIETIIFNFEKFLLA